MAELALSNFIPRHRLLRRQCPVCLEQRGSRRMTACSRVALFETSAASYLRTRAQYSRLYPHQIPGVISRASYRSPYQPKSSATSTTTNAFKCILGRPHDQQAIAEYRCAEIRWRRSKQNQEFVEVRRRVTGGNVPDTRIAFAGRHGRRAHAGSAPPKPGCGASGN